VDSRVGSSIVVNYGGGRGSDMHAFNLSAKSYNNCLLRTVFLRVPTVPSPVGVGRSCRKYQSSGLGTRRSRETMRLQLMLRPLGLPLSQFMRGQVKRLKVDERD
jgi:hypothetical protein